jgi:hypothetical protein
MFLFSKKLELLFESAKVGAVALIDGLAFSIVSFWLLPLAPELSVLLLIISFYIIIKGGIKSIRIGIKAAKTKGTSWKERIIAEANRHKGRAEDAEDEIPNGD